MLVVLINNSRSKCVIFCSLCYNSKCVYVLNAMAGSVSLGTGCEHLWANLHKTNMAADETCVPVVC